MENLQLFLSLLNDFEAILRHFHFFPLKDQKYFEEFQVRFDEGHKGKK